MTSHLITVKHVKTQIACQAQAQIQAQIHVKLKLQYTIYRAMVHYYYCMFLVFFSSAVILTSLPVTSVF